MLIQHTVFIKVGQNSLDTVCIRYFWQGLHQSYGHIWCIYPVLANPIYHRMRLVSSSCNLPVVAPTVNATLQHTKQIANS